MVVVWVGEIWDDWCFNDLHHGGSSIHSLVAYAVNIILPCAESCSLLYRVVCEWFFVSLQIVVSDTFYRHTDSLQARICVWNKVYYLVYRLLYPFLINLYVIYFRILCQNSGRSRKVTVEGSGQRMIWKTL